MTQYWFPVLKYYCNKYPDLFNNYILHKIGKRSTDSMETQIKQHILSVMKEQKVETIHKQRKERKIRELSKTLQ